MGGDYMGDRSARCCGEILKYFCPKIRYNLRKKHGLHVRQSLEQKFLQMMEILQKENNREGYEGTQDSNKELWILS